jgi:CHRD domain
VEAKRTTADVRDPDPPWPRGALSRVTPGGVIAACQDSRTGEEIAMRRRLLVTLVIALALVHGAPVAAGQAMGNANATLTGDAEVPGPGDPKGSGTVVVTLKPDTGDVCYELSVANMQEATAAHIHKGEKGEEGPVAVPLEAPKTGAAKGCTKADVVVIEAIMQDPTDYYVNVHNAAFPKGAVRGQLSR